MLFHKLDELEKAIADAQSELNSLIAAEKPSAITQIKDLMQRYKINAIDLGFAELGESNTGSRKLLAKYRNPTHPDQSWSGRGTRPHWVKHYLSSGGRLDDLLIATPTGSASEGIAQLIDHPVIRPVTVSSH